MSAKLRTADILILQQRLNVPRIFEPIAHKFFMISFSIACENTYLKMKDSLLSCSLLIFDFNQSKNLQPNLVEVIYFFDREILRAII